MENSKKRLFFALDTFAPWPQQLPTGRILDEADRHLTLSFLGEVDYSTLKNQLSSIPKPQIKVGLAGIFNKCMFLPLKHPHVVCWEIKWLDDVKSLLLFRGELNKWLKNLNIIPKNEDREFLPHVTISREPFDKNQWDNSFIKLPLIAPTIHLYESLGYSKYRSLWSFPFLLPFEEFEHTADIAYIIRGESLEQIFNHAQIALAFRFPPLLTYLKNDIHVNNLDDIVIALNEIVAQADTNSEETCPFKAVSFHGTIGEENDKTLKWEMVVDV